MLIVRMPVIYDTHAAYRHISHLHFFGYGIINFVDSKGKF